MMVARNTMRLRGVLTKDEPMSAHTSWRVGGPVDQCYKPVDIEDLKLFLSELPENEKIYWVGLGSNLLVRDGGIRGTVILPFGGLNALMLSADQKIYAGAGVACAKVARFAAKNSLSGAGFLAGIPGTMGGALAMNAGAFGDETWPLVDSVDTLDRHGVEHTRSVEEYEIAYRSVTGPANEWFTGALLQLERGDSALAQEKIKQLLEQRSASQPTSQASCGSVFRNPPGQHAAQLIESCGLKSLQIGNAAVSEKHANFIVNLGAASAADIEQLIQQVKATVLQQKGIELHTEVRVIGVPA